MFEDRDLKVLLGNSIEEPEVDYDDAEVASETGYHPHYVNFILLHL